MTYEPAKYWTRRAKRQGSTYVARGGRKAEYDKEYAVAAPFLREAIPTLKSNTTRSERWWAGGSVRVLDFGCGSGRFRALISEHEREYVGFDLVEGNGTMPFSRELPGGFDVVVATWVLQHIVDPDEYAHWVEQIFNALVPGGRLVVIDQDAGPGPYDPHMMPRGPEALRDAQPWTFGYLHSRWTHHWLGWMEK